MHIHIHRSKIAHDQKFTGAYSGTTSAGKLVTIRATVEAPDAYQAGDKMKALATKRFGEELFHPIVRWEKGASRLQQGSVSQRVASKAGAEEDE